MTGPYHDYSGTAVHSVRKCKNCGTTFDIHDFHSWEGAPCQNYQDDAASNSPPGEKAPVCECGAKKTYGIKDFTRIHSFWCPVFRI